MVSFILIFLEGLDFISLRTVDKSLWLHCTKSKFENPSSKVWSFIKELSVFILNLVNILERNDNKTGLGILWLILMMISMISKISWLQKVMGILLIWLEFFQHWLFPKLHIYKTVHRWLFVKHDFTILLEMCLLFGCLKLLFYPITM